MTGGGRPVVIIVRAGSMLVEAIGTETEPRVPALARATNVGRLAAEEEGAAASATAMTAAGAGTIAPPSAGAKLRRNWS